MRKNAKEVLFILILATALVVENAFGQTTAEAVVTFTCTRVVLGTEFRFTKIYTVNAANESEATRKARVELDKEASQAITVWNLLSTSVSWKDPKAAAQMFSKNGETHYDNERYDSAITDYTEAIRLNPNISEYYNMRGNSYNEKSDYDRAITDFTQAMRLNPNNAVFYNNRGNAYYYKSDWDRAIADYTEAIRLNSNYANPYRNRANAYIQKGNFTQARADVNRALQINPNYQSARELSAALQRHGY